MVSMPVPEDIRRVERPANTVVQDSKKDGPRRYSVRERNGTKYVPGGNPQPINGKTIGYIIDHKFVPVCEKTAASGPTMLSYGASALVKSVCDDILTDLLKVFPANDAFSIMSIAALKVIRPRISGSRLGSAYNTSFVSVFWPGAALSKNSITALYRNLGADGNKRAAFFELRISRVCADDHVIIDGTLKQDTSLVNDLSAFSYKARLKGCEDISILYAYDLEKMEPICSQVFPGNSIDAVSYRSFIKDNGLQRGIIISDKGFPPNEIRDILGKSPLLHYITPVKRNDKRIREYGLTRFDGVLAGVDKTVQYKKAQVAPGIWMYAYKDQGLAAAEEKSYLEHAREKDSYDNAQYAKKKETFGLIVFESDRDLDEKTAYLCYAERWKLELVFKAYKSDECLDRTSVQGDFSIHGSEFVNFISTLLTCRIITKATKAGLFHEMTYRDMIEDLNTAWRRTDAPPEEKPVTGDQYWVHTIPMVSETLERLELSQPVVASAPRKKGSKANTKPNQKEPNGQETTKPINQPEDKADKENPDGSQVTVKRSVGRPRKKPAPDPNVPKRPVGRPRKKPLPDPDAPKRPVGRPRIRPLPDPNAPKRSVGRPRKQQGN